jgi:3-methyl-2-oxobutanoate hydroxymethyltransferase
MLGWTYGFTPRHAKKYENLAERMSAAVGSYVDEVGAGSFPGPEHSSSMDAAVLEEVLGGGPLDRPMLDEEYLDALPLDRDL